jgi:hypothetical protein
MTDWIEWSGGECPVSPDKLVEVKCSDGYTTVETANSFFWEHGLEGVADITAYRLYETEQPKQSKLKDSGERREVSTGAVRDRAVGKGRFDLLPVYGLLAAAKQMEEGALKYADRNWEKGMPLSWFADSAKRHLVKFIAGYDDEPHLDAAIWNLMCLAEGQERINQGLWPAELDDMPKTYAGKHPNF